MAAAIDDTDRRVTTREVDDDGVALSVKRPPRLGPLDLSGPFGPMGARP